MDYRSMNAVSMLNVYLILLIWDLLGVVVKGKIFTKLELRDAYFHILLTGRGKNGKLLSIPCLANLNMWWCCLVYKGPQWGLHELYQ